MFKENMLLAKMAEKNVTRTMLSERLKLSLSAVCNKINGKNDFTGSEICSIIKLLHLSQKETFDIFFA